MTLKEATARVGRVKEIAVGKKSFPGELWEKAIRVYLDESHADDGVVHPLLLMFNNNVILHLSGGEHYVGYYLAQSGAGIRIRVSAESQLTISDPTRAEVENGLGRFLRNKSIRQLIVVFPAKGSFVLTKAGKRDKPDLFVAMQGHFQSHVQYTRQALKAGGGFCR